MLNQLLPSSFKHKEKFFETSNADQLKVRLISQAKRVFLNKVCPVWEWIYNSNYITNAIYIYLIEFVMEIDKH
jgi:hypothetical protein